MSYTKRTCVECGYRDIQPNMHRVSKMVHIGKSQTGTNVLTWLGALFGHKPSQRAVSRQIFNTSKRNYYRKRKVWVCSDCVE